MSTIINNNFAQGKRPCSYLHVHSEYGFSWIDGIVGTQHGFVEVMSQNGKAACSQVRFIWRGRAYSRTFSGAAYSSRFLVTLANRYAHEIVEQAGRTP